jgi:hypothetical protein
MADNNGNNSATTVLIAVVIVVIIGIAFYFGFVRGNWGGNNAPNDINVELNTPDLGGEADGGTQ